MKKIYTLLFTAVLAFSANAQTNLVPNGGFESWTDGTPDGVTVTVPANGGSLTQETTDVQAGTSSAKFTAPAGTGNVRGAFTDIPVIAGHEYTFSYWYKDESDNARGRHWASWRAGTAQLTDNLAVLQPDYMANTTGWQQVTITLEAPATATAFRLDYRVYQETGNSGIILYDSISLVDNDDLSTKNNQIQGLKVYPNPVTNGTFYINTNADSTKEVVVYDVLGKQVVKTTTNNAVNVSNLKGGVYIVKITEEGKTATRKLVIK